MNLLKIEKSLVFALTLIRHVKIKAHANPYDKDWHGYFEERMKKEQFVNSWNISKFRHAN
jgi:hypothetical protein